MASLKLDSQPGKAFPFPHFLLRANKCCVLGCSLKIGRVTVALMWNILRSLEGPFAKSCFMRPCRSLGILADSHAFIWEMMQLPKHVVNQKRGVFSQEHRASSAVPVLPFVQCNGCYKVPGAACTLALQTLLAASWRCELRAESSKGITGTSHVGRNVV